MKRCIFLILILCLLLCTACSEQTAPPVTPDAAPETVIQPEPVTEPDESGLPKRLPVYIYSGETDKAIDSQGNVLLEGEAGSLSLLRDVYTGELVGIQRSCHEGKTVDEWGFAQPERVWCQLYDPEGNFLLQLESSYVTVSGGLMSYYVADTDSYTVLRSSDGSTVAEGLRSIWLLDGMIVTKDIQWKSPSTVLDGNGNELWTQPEGWYIEGYHHDDGQYYLTAVDPEGLTGLVDLAGQTVLPCQYSQIRGVTKGRATVQDADGWRVLELATGETLMQWPYCIYSLFDRSAVVQSGEDFGRFILVDFEGNRLSDRVFQWVNLTDDDLDGMPELLHGNLDRSEELLPDGVTALQESVAFLRPDGTEVFCAEYTGGHLEPINSNIVLRREMLPEDDTAFTYTLFDLTTEKAIPLPRRQYYVADMLWYYTSRPQPEDRQYFILSYQNELGHYRACVADTTGQILLDELKNCLYLGGGVFRVSRGFETGLMDLNGNWLYCQSQFTSVSSD